MRFNYKKSLLAFAFSFAAFPLWAAHTYSADWKLDQAMTIGSTEIQSGQYELKIEEGKSELQVLQKNKVMATVPVQWIKLPTKAQSFTVLSDGNKVTELKFAGSDQAVQINQ